MKFIEYTGDDYPVGKSWKSYSYRNDYVRIEWSTGFVVMRKSHWEKLPKYKKKLLLSLN